MTLLSTYLSQPKIKKVLAQKPGQEGFSLIELVVVVAVLAVLSAIAIPQFTNISMRARTAAAMNTLATIAKECAVKFYIHRLRVLLSLNKVVKELFEYILDQFHL